VRWLAAHILADALTPRRRYVLACAWQPRQWSFPPCLLLPYVFSVPAHRGCTGRLLWLPCRASVVRCYDQPCCSWTVFATCCLIEYAPAPNQQRDRKSTRLNSSHV